jgi:hypothetical protein
VRERGEGEDEQSWAYGYPPKERKDQLHYAVLKRYIRHVFFPLQNRIIIITVSSSSTTNIFTTSKTKPTQPNPIQTTNMQFTLATLTALLSLTSAAAVIKRYPATLVSRQSGICGGLATALCCQTDVLGVANLNCANGKSYYPHHHHHHPSRKRRESNILANAWVCFVSRSWYHDYRGL